jgi:3-oxo-4-pregnene-20-carboxyl-CoA dehydrogenase alpha subunit
MSSEATEVGEVIRAALERAGGVDLVRRATVDPDTRKDAAVVFDAVGVWDLAPASDQVEFEIAAAVCRAAGGFAAPYPVVERLGRCASAGATVLTGASGARMGMHLDLPLDWTAIDMHGREYTIADRSALLRMPLAPFGVEFEAQPTESSDPRGAAVLLVLQSWWLLGLLERAHADTVRFSREREQFGRSIAQFQSVGFMLADELLEVSALHDLAKYTLWSVANAVDPSTALIDGIALRVASLRACEAVMRSAHQLHGAMGFTNEVDLSWLSKASQGPRRLPEGRHATEARLAAMMGRNSLQAFGRADAVVQLTR